MSAASTLPRPVPASRRPRLGFLGTGWIGRDRLQAIARDGCAQVAVIADSSPQNAREAQAAAPGAEIVDGLEALLERELDGVVIATPSALHAAQAATALRSGCAVFCQKPLGRDAREVREVVEAAAAADRLLGVDLSYRFSEAASRVREAVRCGRLGRVYAVEMAFHNAYGPDKPWFHERELSGGGCLIDLGVHLVDLALWTLDFPKVEALSARLLAGGRPLSAPAAPVEDYASARLELEGGTLVQLACSWRLPAGRDAVIEASFYGSEGGASLRNVAGSFYDFRAYAHAGTQSCALSEPPDAWGGRAAVGWVRSLAEGAGFDSGSAEQLVRVAEVLDGLYADGLVPAQERRR